MSLLQRRGARATLTVLAVAGLGFSIPLLPAAADPSPAAACLEAGNVWVHVELDETVSGGCATAFGTGLEALASAGFTAVAPGGFVSTIDGKPAPRGEEDWWAYAHTDDALKAWEFYLVGGAESKPVAGSIEAWRLMHTYSQDVSSLPLVTPAKLLADVEPAPSPSPSVSATPSASTAPTPSATTKPAPSLPNTGN
ncbi:MAG: hypothetical protein Q4P15_11670 [Propionibacteriaceae bacterium]|nr:hypothetical protein [Propionibacteriaceae bacterium]